VLAAAEVAVLETMALVLAPVFLALPFVPPAAAAEDRRVIEEMAFAVATQDMVVGVDDNRVVPNVDTPAAAAAWNRDTDMAAIEIVTAALETAAEKVQREVVAAAAAVAEGLVFEAEKEVAVVNAAAAAEVEWSGWKNGVEQQQEHHLVVFPHEYPYPLLCLLDPFSSHPGHSYCTSPPFPAVAVSGKLYFLADAVAVNPTMDDSWSPETIG
jgi:hypothetical protein